MPIKNGDTIKVDYEGKLDDGTVFDSSKKHGKPLEFTIGKKQVIKGFEEGVIGMNEGEEKEIVIPAEKAYGENNPELIKKFPRNKMPDQNIQPGMFVQFNLPNAVVARAKVTEVTDTEVTLDLNHPLAGKTLHFKIKIVSIS
jgi:FKBP-type peptidyl-prolyl cis-trans isomerase 2